MQHPSVPEDSPRFALWCIRTIVRRFGGHRLGPARDGLAACRGCGAVMVDDDAYAYMKSADETLLGSFARPCQGKEVSQ